MAIFAHSVRLVVANIGIALRLSAIPYALVASIALYFQFQSGLPEAREEIGPFPAVAPAEVGLAALAGLLTVFVYLWVAMSWHRFVLRDEAPLGWFPRFRARAFLSYLWRGLLLVLLTFVVASIVSFPLGLIATASGAPTWVIAFLILGISLSVWLFFRLCVMLPAAAIGRSMDIGEAWQCTTGFSLAIVVLVVITVSGSLLLQLPALLLGGPSSHVAIVYGAVLNWVFLMFGASILTTCYSHFVEGRPLG